MGFDLQGGAESARRSMQPNPTQQSLADVAGGGGGEGRGCCSHLLILAHASLQKGTNVADLALRASQRPGLVIVESQEKGRRPKRATGIRRRAFRFVGRVSSFQGGEPAGNPGSCRADFHNPDRLFKYEKSMWEGRDGRAEVLGSPRSAVLE